MTAELEYSYLNADFMLRVNEEVMSRAVRVKVSAKDKIKRIFDKNVVSQTNNEMTAHSVEETGMNALIDTSEEKLAELNNIINGMQQQQNIPYTVKRAVLFTSALSQKIRKVTDKMFGEMPKVEKQNVDLPSVEISNHLGGEVLSSTWFNAPSDVVGNTLNLEPTLEAVPSIEPVSAESSVESQTSVELDNALPVVQENEVSLESDVPSNEIVPSIDIPFVNSDENVENKFDAVPVSNEEMPSFMTNFGESFVSEPQNLVAPQNEVSSVELPKIENEVNPYEFSFEPTQINLERDFVPEPNEISTVEEKESSEIESSGEVPFEMPFVGEVAVSSVEESSVPMDNVVNNEPEVVVEKPKMSIEDKIAELLSRKNANLESNNDVKLTSVSEEQPNENLDRNIRSDKPEMTQARLIARVQRVNNSMKEKDATIKSLTLKYESAKKEASDFKGKMSGYEAVVSDLTIRNNLLVQENERLSAKVKDSEIESQTTIESLENQVAELNDLRSKENETSKKTIADLTEKYEAEIAALKSKHSKEISSLNESHERQIQTIYSTIAETLSDSYDSDYDSGYSLAA